MIFFFIFLHRKRVTHRKRKKGGSAVTNRTVELCSLHSWYLYQSKQKFVLCETIESFFLIHFIFQVVHQYIFHFREN